MWSQSSLIIYDHVIIVTGWLDLSGLREIEVTKSTVGTSLWYPTIQFFYYPGFTSYLIIFDSVIQKREDFTPKTALRSDNPNTFENVAEESFNTFKSTYLFIIFLNSIFVISRRTQTSASLQG